MFRNCITGSSLQNHFMYDFPKVCNMFYCSNGKTNTKTGMIYFVIS